MRIKQTAYSLSSFVIQIYQDLVVFFIIIIYAYMLIVNYLRPMNNISGRRCKDVNMRKKLNENFGTLCCLQSREKMLPHIHKK